MASVGRPAEPAEGADSASAQRGPPAVDAATPDWISVSQLNEQTDALLRRVGMLRVQGELSGVTMAASGHWYFSLKDRLASVRAVMFRNAARAVRFRPIEGTRVEVEARIGLYAARGDFQLQVERMRIAGAGDLHARFLALKELLQSEGLFDAARKRPLPARIAKIGVITSTGAAALHDVLSTLARRDPRLEVIIYPAMVQGASAPAMLIDALQRANRRNEVDVLLLVRGGGSIEDLMAFNDERLARAIAASALPVVSGVGHDVDFTIADFVADLRMPTPTGAAVAVSRDIADDVQHLSRLAQQLQRSFDYRLDRLGQRLDLGMRLLVSPTRSLELHERHWSAIVHRLQRCAHSVTEAREWRLRDLSRRVRPPDLEVPRQKLRTRVDRLHAAQRAHLQQREARLDAAVAALKLVDPSAVLRRGYAWVQRQDGHIVRSASEVRIGEALDIALGAGRIGVTVDRKDSVRTDDDRTDDDRTDDADRTEDIRDDAEASELHLGRDPSSQDQDSTDGN